MRWSRSLCVGSLISVPGEKVRISPGLRTYLAKRTRVMPPWRKKKRHSSSSVSAPDRPLVVQQLQEGGEVHVQPDDTPDDGVDGDELRVRDVVAPEREAEQPVHDEEDVPGQNRDC